MERKGAISLGDLTNPVVLIIFARSKAVLGYDGPQRAPVGANKSV